MGAEANEKFMKTKEEDTQTQTGSSPTGEGTNFGIERAFDQEAIPLLANYYWEARGCPHGSPDEHWFRAEAALHNRLAAAAAAWGGTILAEPVNKHE